MNDINERQNSAYAMQLQRAIHAAHARVRHVNSIRYVVAVALSLVAMGLALTGRSTVWLAVVGGTWAVADFLLGRLWCRQTGEHVALLQERLDTWLYDMPWDETLGPAPGLDMVGEWERRWRDGDGQFANWYPDVRHKSATLAVLACQRVNLAWDQRLRRRFGRILVGAVVAWCVLGIATGVVLAWSARDVILRWFVPSAAALILAGELAWQQYDVGARKARMLAVIAHVTGEANPEPDEQQLRQLARVVQVRLTELRMRAPRVPSFLYRRYRRQDQGDFAAVIADSPPVRESRADNS